LGVSDLELPGHVYVGEAIKTVHQSQSFNGL